ncbi:MAG: capsid assembly protein [Alphaproteobacteria bacterium]
MTETILDPAPAAPEPVVPEPPAPAPAGPPARPDHVPEVFWDPHAGQVRVDDLARAYAELAAAERPPETADGYDFPVPETLGATDPEIDRRLHAAGFTNAQARLVYDLAAEVVAPLVGSAAAAFEADRQTERLERAFGGADRWREASRQLLAWGKANLRPDMLHALSTTYEGVMALKQMMASGEPAVLGHGPAQPPEDEDGLRALMRDPRYWRDRDPRLVNHVEEGFRRLYGDAR